MCLFKSCTCIKKWTACIFVIVLLSILNNSKVLNLYTLYIVKYTVWHCNILGIISADLVEDKIYFMIWERLLNSQLLIFFAQCKINKNQSFLTSNVIGIDIYICFGKKKARLTMVKNVKHFTCWFMSCCSKREIFLYCIVISKFINLLSFY